MSMDNATDLPGKAGLLKISLFENAALAMHHIADQIHTLRHIRVPFMPSKRCNPDAHVRLLRCHR